MRYSTVKNLRPYAPGDETAPSEQRLDQLFIAPDAQGLGIGRALFDVAKRRLPDGFWLATHSDNRHARAHYEQRGMTLDRVEPGNAGDRAFYSFTPPAP